MKMPNPRPPKNAQQEPNYSTTAPRGMWYEQRDGRDQPFIARWRLPGGAKDSRAFASAKERGEFAATWLARRKEHGIAAVLASPREVETWREFARLTGGANPLDVAQFWLRMRGIVDGKLTVADAIKRFVEAQAGRSLSPDSVSHRNLHLERFADAHGKKQLHEITGAVVAEWIRGLKSERGGGGAMSATSKAHHRATVNRLFAHAVAARWIDVNPCASVPVPDAEEKETVNILTVEQARELFTANKSALCLGRLALEAFAGLRYTSAARVHLADIDHKEKGIVLPGRKHKTGRRHYVDGFPANLWAWLAVAPEEGWDLNQRLYLNAKRRAFERANLKPEQEPRALATPEEKAQLDAMRNVLRHSFATYHLAAFRDAPKTAVLLTHRNPSMLYQYYKGRASEAAGKAYFEIMPA